MKTKVLKRDHRLVAFDEERIVQAILGAMKEVGTIDSPFAVNTAYSIAKKLEDKAISSVSVENIQDMVEEALMASEYKNVARAYVLYRDKRTKARTSNSDAIITGIINAEHNDITRENANSDANTPAGMMAKIASERSKEYAHNYLLTNKSKGFMDANLLYPHDCDYLPTRSLTCATGKTNIIIKNSKGAVKHVRLEYLDKYFKSEPSKTPEMIRTPEFIWIMGRNGWTRITGITRREMMSDENLYNIKTRKGTGIELTGDHLVPVIDKMTGTEVLKDVESVKVGDKLLSPLRFDEDKIGEEYIDIASLMLSFPETSSDVFVVANIGQLRGWLKYKYGINSLYKYLHSDTYRYGNSYITLQDYKRLQEDFDIPLEVLRSMDIHCLNGKDFLPMYLPVSPELAKVCGYIHSDGAVSCSPETGNYQISFTGFNPEINDNFKKVFTSVFPNHLCMRKIEGKYAGWLFSSKLLSFLFKFALGMHKGSTHLSIPEFVKNGSDEIKWSYLSAVIDGDGCISHKGRYQLSISSSCEEYIKELILLLNSVGVSASYQSKNVKGTQALFPNGNTGTRRSDFFKIIITGYDNIYKVLDNLNCIKRNSIDMFYAQKPSNAVVYDPLEVTKKIEMCPDGVVVYDLETVEHWWVANNYVLHNCIQHPMDKLLSGGFTAGHGQSRPSKRIETASILCAISLETVQNLMHGGQAIPAIDYYLAPYVRLTYIEELKKIEKIVAVDLSEYYNAEVEDFIKKETTAGDYRQLAINETVIRVHQAMEAFIHNMNTIHSRAGNQVVFSSINYGTDTSAEGRCVIRELLLTTERGVGNGSTAIFPIQIWKLKAGVSKNPGDRNYDLYQLACRVTARRFFPNFLNLDATFNKDELWREDDPKRYEHEVATMGCRTRVYENRHGEKCSIARGNLSFSTINLPGLALSVRNIENEDARIKAFFEKLDELVNATADQLYDRYKFQCEAKAKQFPLLMSGMWKDSENLKPEDKVEPVLKHGTLGVGFIGLAECLIALIGKHHGESKEAQELGLKIVSFMKGVVDKRADEVNLNYSVIATPAEGLSGKFTKKDKVKYGVVPGVTDKDYYTNSNHVPVYYKCSAAHKAKIEGPYHELTRGGHIFYVELDGDATHNVEAIYDIVNLMDKNNIGYCSVNHNRNRCMECGYEDAQESLDKCPACGCTEIDTIQRITGYLVGGISKWNSGKLAELKDRVTHGK